MLTPAVTIAAALYLSMPAYLLTLRMRGIAINRAASFIMNDARIPLKTAMIATIDGGDFILLMSDADAR